MINLIDSIPYDIIINVIEPFTRSIQNNNLLKDIISFKKTINSIYHKYCINLYNIISPLNQDINAYEKNIIDKLAWYFLEIDLHCFIIEFEIYDGFLQLIDFATFLRLIHIADVNNIVENSEYIRTKGVVFKLWGFLSVDQRKQFIEIHDLF
tara:strand:- start:632 stop:1087 length:456 start_codon:yes stop_codon:yes gene_type:complete